jgi:hypothetical protein
MDFIFGRFFSSTLFFTRLFLRLFLTPFSCCAVVRRVLGWSGEEGSETRQGVEGKVGGGGGDGTGGGGGGGVPVKWRVIRALRPLCGDSQVFFFIVCR